MRACVPDVAGSDEDGLLALQAGDAVHRELADVVTAVGVHIWQLDRGVNTHVTMETRCMHS